MTRIKTRKYPFACAFILLTIPFGFLTLEAAHEIVALEKPSVVE